MPKTQTAKARRTCIVAVDVEATMASEGETAWADPDCLWGVDKAGERQTCPLTEEQREWLTEYYFDEITLAAEDRETEDERKEWPR